MTVHTLTQHTPSHTPTHLLRCVHSPLSEPLTGNDVHRVTMATARLAKPVEIAVDHATF